MMNIKENMYHLLLILNLPNRKLGLLYEINKKIIIIVLAIFLCIVFWVVSTNNSTPISYDRKKVIDNAAAYIMLSQVYITDYKEHDSNTRYDYSKGYKKDDGNFIKCYTGEYVFHLESETYNCSKVIEVLSTSDETSQNVGMTPILDENEYRIVLTWGNVPSDLDSHLLGLNSGEQVFHIYYNQKVYYENGELVAQLDLDDVSGYGPETVTITLVAEEGYDYLYYVHDYSNGRDDSSSYLSLSGARVSVYGGNELIKNYIVPINVEGTNWIVFKIEDGKIIDINEIHKSVVW